MSLAEKKVLHETLLNHCFFLTFFFFSGGRHVSLPDRQPTLPRVKILMHTKLSLHINGYSHPAWGLACDDASTVFA